MAFSQEELKNLINTQANYDKLNELIEYIRPTMRGRPRPLQGDAGPITHIERISAPNWHEIRQLMDGLFGCCQMPSTAD